MGLFGSMAAAWRSARTASFEFAFFLQNLAHKDVRPGRSRVQPDRPLQQSFGVIVFLDSRVGVGQLVVRSRTGRISE